MHIKKITKEDNDNFWAAFDMRHPDISKEFANKDFVDGSIGFTAFQPKTMDNDTFRIFQRYLARWMSDNGFTQPIMDVVYFSLNDGDNKGVRAMDSSSILKIEQADNNLCRVTFKEDGTDKILAIYVKEDLEKLKASAYIF